MDISSQPPAAKPRRPWLAAVLSLLAPGLGHVYVGRPLRAVALLTSLGVAIAAWAYVSMRVHSAAFRLVSCVLVVCLWLAVFVDAARMARKAADDYRPRRYNRALFYGGAFLIVAFALQPLFSSSVKAGIARAYVLPGEMMSPTLRPGDYIYALPFAPKPVPRGALVVWRDSTGGDFIQRVAALPGDTVEMRSKRLHINGSAVREPYVTHVDPRTDPSDSLMLWQQRYLLHEFGSPYRPSRDNWGPIAIPAKQYLLLGDNRDNSYDGRYRGLVREDAIVGQPVWVYYSRDPESGKIRWERIGRDVR